MLTDATTPDSDDTYIERADVDHLIDAHRKGTWDASSRRLLAEEFAALDTWFRREGAGHAAPDLDDPRTQPGTLMGLAISGGGIRSATFALGVLQRLARENLLHKFDYLSTVSGGGYIGSALTWWRNCSKRRQPDTEDAHVPLPEGATLPTGLGAATFPFGTDDPARPLPARPADPEAAKRAEGQRRLLRFLRQHGNYLNPGGGLDLVAALVTALRGVVLSLAAWVTLLALLMLALLQVPGWVASVTPSNTDVLDDWKQSVMEGGLPGLGVPQLLEWVLCEDAQACNPSEAALARCTARAFGCPGIDPAPACDGCPVGAVPPVFVLLLWGAFAVGAALLAGWAGYSLWTWLRIWSRTRYRVRRLFERVLGVVTKVALAALVLSAVPVVYLWFAGFIAEAGAAAAVGGALTALWTFLGRSGGGRVPLSVVAAVGALLTVFALAVGAYALAGWLAGQGASWGIGFAVIAVVYLVVVNLNYVSIHRLYRDRLMEAFLPEPGFLTEAVPPSPAADTGKLHHCWAPGATSGPYLLINANVVLVDSSDRTRRLRGGDSFLLSPLYCGSNATGWRRSKGFLQGKLTLATAVAISGAAADPATGPGGVGVTRSRPVALLMSIFGVSLGYWAANPERGWGRFLRPNHLHPGLSVALRGLHRHGHYVRLSDGGHFDNLGLYELVRRRTRLIVLSDGAADPGYAFADFQVLLRRIEADFGASIRFDADNRLERLIPKHKAGYPPEAKVADRGFVVGTVHYCDGTRGVLVYLKTTRVDGVSLKTKGYAAAHADFPDQTTADQFFDEDQFEAYRELGYRLAEHMLRDVRYAARTGLKELVAYVEAGHLHPG